MPEEIVHKIIPVFRVQPRPLTDLVLCWRNMGQPAENTETPMVSKSINNVTCPACWKLWVDGVQLS